METFEERGTAPEIKNPSKVVLTPDGDKIALLFAEKISVYTLGKNYHMLSTEEQEYILFLARELLNSTPGICLKVEQVREHSTFYETKYLPLVKESR